MEAEIASLRAALEALKAGGEEWRYRSSDLDETRGSWKTIYPQETWTPEKGGKRRTAREVALYLARYASKDYPVQRRTVSEWQDVEAEA